MNTWFKPIKRVHQSDQTGNLFPYTSEIGGAGARVRPSTNLSTSLGLHFGIRERCPCSSWWHCCELCCELTTTTHCPPRKGPRAPFPWRVFSSPAATPVDQNSWVRTRLHQGGPPILLGQGLTPGGGFHILLCFGGHPQANPGPKSLLWTTRPEWGAWRGNESLGCFWGEVHTPTWVASHCRVPLHPEGSGKPFYLLGPCSIMGVMTLPWGWGDGCLFPAREGDRVSEQERRSPQAGNIVTLIIQLRPLCQESAALQQGAWASGPAPACQAATLCPPALPCERVAATEVLGLFRRAGPGWRAQE